MPTSNALRPDLMTAVERLDEIAEIWPSGSCVFARACATPGQHRGDRFASTSRPGEAVMSLPLVNGDGEYDRQHRRAGGGPAEDADA